jgi:dsRNA-specific ribonuclease
VSLEPRTRAVVEAALGYVFNDTTIVEQALTHRSLSAEHKATASNEPSSFSVTRCSAS